MDQVPTDPLQEALALIKAGEYEEASVVLARFLKHNPGHERAWHMLSYTLTDREKQIYALQRVLQINPENKAARSQLARHYDGITSPAEPPLPASRSAKFVPAPTQRGQWLSRITKRLAVSPALLFGSLITLAFLVVAAVAPLIAPPEDADFPYLVPKYGFGSFPTPPGPDHPLGLMPGQYDVFYGLVWGTRAALKVGLFVTLGRVLIGAVLGLISGHFGKVVDAVIMRAADAFMAFPVIAAVMVMVALFARELQTSPGGSMFLVPSREEQVVILTLVAFGWTSYARLVRGNVLSEREKDYIQAATAIGAGNRRVIFRHLLPNVTQGLYVLIASDIGAVVVLITTFTFIGLIHSPSGHLEADWGHMLTASRDWIIGSPTNAFEHWYTYLPVSAAIVLFSIGWNLIGDGLRDVLDPRLRKASRAL